MDCSATSIPSLSITGCHPQPTGEPVGESGGLPFCRGAVGVFYCPSRPGVLTTIGVLSLYSTALADRAFLPLLQGCSWYILHPQPSGRFHPFCMLLLAYSTARADRTVLSLCRSAFDVFYIPSRQGTLTLLHGCCRRILLS